MLCYWPTTDPKAWDNLPQDIQDYIRYLRRYIVNLEQTEPQQKITELENQIRGLQVDLEDAQTVIAQQQQTIQERQQQLVDLKAQLNQNSSNSSLPPSSDRFHVKRRPPQPASGRPKGGQPNHRRRTRPLVPPEQVDQTISCVPTACRKCGHPLSGTDPEPLRHQVVELPPPVRPEVTEYQLHRLTCPHCRTSTCAALPEGVRGHYGPRLEGTLAVLAGGYRQSIRAVQVLANTLWNLVLSTGMISKLRRQTAEALQQPYAEVHQYIQNQNVNIDETSWREGREKGYLWITVAKKAVYFKIAMSRGRWVAEEILGTHFRKVATCDRLRSYWWIKRLQWCWAHLQRDFQAMIDRETSGRRVGKRLLRLSKELFRIWHTSKAGQRSRRWFAARHRDIAAGFTALRRGHRVVVVRRTAG